MFKLINDVVNPDQSWAFNLYLGPNDSGDGSFLSDPVASDNTSGDPDGVLEFITPEGNPYNLDPNLTYTICEMELPAGWGAFWRVDSDNDGVVDATIIPYNPNESDDPPEDLGNRCYDFTVGAGNTLLFEVRNYYPGGEPRTPGYWKNWNRVTGGGQQYTADQNGGWENGFWLLEDVLDPTIGGGIMWDDILPDSYLPLYVSPITLAEVAVDILDQREIDDPNVAGDGVKHSNDAAYTLAMHLLASQLNFGAYAASCDAARDAALEGETLLDAHDFNGVGDYLLSGHADYAYALDLADQLDRYNNGELCVGPAVNIDSPVGGTTFTSTDSSPVTIQVSVQDLNEVTQVEFLVDGVSLGVDADGSDGWTMNWEWVAAADGAHTIEAIATNDLFEEGQADVTVFVDLIADVYMHVESLVGDTALQRSGKWDAWVTTKIVDSGTLALDAATVFAQWSNGDTGSCVTGISGTCDISTVGSKKIDSLTFTVTDVIHDTYTYDASANVDSEVTLYK